MNQFQAPNESTLTVHCERGTVRFESHHARWQWMTEPSGAWQNEPSSPLERDTAYIRQANLLLDAVEGQRPPLCSVAEGMQTLRVNLAILASQEDRAWKDVATFK